GAAAGATPPPPPRPRAPPPPLPPPPPPAYPSLRSAHLSPCVRVLAMSYRSWTCLAALTVFTALAAVRAADAPIPGIGPVGPIQKLHTGFAFTEGPAADGQGNLYFSDIPNERIHKLTADGKLTVFRE